MKTVSIQVPGCELCELPAQAYGGKCDACGVKFCESHATELSVISFKFEIYQRLSDENTWSLVSVPMGFIVCKGCFEKPEIQQVIAQYIAVDLKIQEASRLYAALPFSRYAVIEKAHGKATI